MAAEYVCSDILTKIRDSKLNFILSETPFSVHLTIRKSFVKKNQMKSFQDSQLSPSVTKNIGDLNGQIDLLNRQLGEKCDQYEEVTKELHATKANLLISKANTNILESKIEKVEADALDLMSKNKIIVMEKVEKIEALEDVVKNFHIELDQTKNALEATKKKLDVKDKLISKHKSEMKSQNKVKEGLDANVLELSTENEKLRRKLDIKIDDIENVDESECEVESNIETNNNFEILGDQMNKASTFNQTAPAKTVKASHNKMLKIDWDNYQNILEDFLKNFRDDSSEAPKYLLVAEEMVNKNYNMFHVALKDVRKFNINLGGFLAANYQSLALDTDIVEIIKKFIEENLGPGLLKHDVYFSLNRSKWSKLFYNEI